MKSRLPRKKSPKLRYAAVIAARYANVVFVSVRSKRLYILCSFPVKVIELALESPDFWPEVSLLSVEVSPFVAPRIKNSLLLV